MDGGIYIEMALSLDFSRNLVKDSLGFWPNILRESGFMNTLVSTAIFRYFLIWQFYYIFYKFTIIFIDFVEKIC